MMNNQGDRTSTVLFGSFGNWTKALPRCTDVILFSSTESRFSAKILHPQFVLNRVLLFKQFPFRLRWIAVHNLASMDRLDLPLAFLPAFFKLRFAFGRHNLLPALKTSPYTFVDRAN